MPAMPLNFEDVDGLLVHPDYRDVLARNGVCGFDALMHTAGERRLDKPGLAAWRERIELMLDTAQDPRRFFLKRFIRPPLGQQFRRALRGYSSTAQVEWSWLMRLRRLDIRVPEPVACGARKLGPLERCSVLLTAELPGESLEKWLPAHVSDLSPSARVHLMEALADLAGRLHGAGLVHRDLYLSHIFVHWQTSDRCTLSLLDLQRVMAPGLRRRRWLVKDLAALNYSTPPAAASRTDRLRWLKMYLRISKPVGDQRSLIRAIESKTKRIARHSAKRGLG